MALGARLRELMQKYGKVAFGVHCSVSVASITGLYLAINNNVEIEPLLAKVGVNLERVIGKVGLSNSKPENQQQASSEQISGSKTVDLVIDERPMSSEQISGSETVDLVFDERHISSKQISGSETVDLVFDETPISKDPFSSSSSSERKKTSEIAASTGGAFALALLCNKALFPVRVPITIALTPPIARFLARRRIIKTHT